VPDIEHTQSSDLELYYLGLINNIDENYLIEKLRGKEPVPLNGHSMNDNSNSSLNRSVGVICTDEIAKNVMHGALVGPMLFDNNEKLMYLKHSTKKDSSLFSSSDTTNNQSSNERTYLTRLTQMGTLSYIKDTSSLIANYITQPVLTTEFVLKYRISLASLIKYGVGISDLKRSGIAKTLGDLDVNLKFTPTDLRINKKLFNITHLRTLYNITKEIISKRYKSDNWIKCILIDMLTNCMELNTMEIRFQDIFLSDQDSKEESHVYSEQDIKSKLLMYRLFITCNYHTFKLYGLEANIIYINELLGILTPDSIDTWKLFLEMNYESVYSAFNLKSDIIKFISLICNKRPIKIDSDTNDIGKPLQNISLDSLKLLITNESNESNKSTENLFLESIQEYGINETTSIESKTNAFSCVPNLMLLICKCGTNDKQFTQITKQLTVFEVSSKENLIRSISHIFSTEKTKVTDKDIGSNKRTYDKFIRQMTNNNTELVPSLKQIPTFSDFLNPTQWMRTDTVYKREQYNSYREKIQRKIKAIIKRDCEIFFIDPYQVTSRLYNTDKCNLYCFGLVPCQIVTIERKN
jgi:hypothetical protein